MTKNIYISIDDGPYPTFTITKDKISGVQVPVPSEQVAFWKETFKQYQRVQKEIETYVNHYEPLAISKAIAQRAKMIERNRELQNKSEPKPGENYPPYPES